jgi:hypothetical protein
MPATNSPYGMDPVQSITAAPNNLAVRQFLIDPANGTAIYAGDVAKMVTTGYVDKDVGTAANTPVGVFTGFEFTSVVTKQRLQSTYFPGAASVITTDPIWASVCDDPFMLFSIQGDAAFASLAAAQAALGANAPLVQTAGNAQFGRSRNALAVGTIGTAATLPLRIIDFLRTADNVLYNATTPQYVQFLVRFNTHAYLVPLGI